MSDPSWREVARARRARRKAIAATIPPVSETLTREELWAEFAASGATVVCMLGQQGEMSMDDLRSLVWDARLLTALGDDDA